MKENQKTWKSLLRGQSKEDSIWRENSPQQLLQGLPCSAEKAALLGGCCEPAASTHYPLSTLSYELCILFHRRRYQDMGYILYTILYRTTYSLAGEKILPGMGLAMVPLSSPPATASELGGKSQNLISGTASKLGGKSQNLISKCIRWSWWCSPGATETKIDVEIDNPLAPQEGPANICLMVISTIQYRESYLRR